MIKLILRTTKVFTEQIKKKNKNGRGENIFNWSIPNNTYRDRHPKCKAKRALDGVANLLVYF